MRRAIPLVERLARRQADDRARADRLRAQVSGLARFLRYRGATRVVLFGSLATGSEPHEKTDIDLCVEGLDESAAAEALLELERLARADVDLVVWESASPRLRARIERDGVEVGR
jgi:predicted nucleotidyltransferase